MNVNGRRRVSRARGVASDIAAVARSVAMAHAGRAWPAEKWQADPVGFARIILGVELWSAQIEILEAIRDYKRVAVHGGRKIGKDFAVAMAALWWFSSFPDAVVFMSATTAKQIDEILYIEIRRMWARSGKCLACKLADPRNTKPPPCPHSALLAGEVGELARTGIRASDFRRLFGYTAKHAEGLAGVSGPRILALIDEASRFPDELHQAIRGNLAAEGCHEVLISNPTRTRGFFFEACKKDGTPYKVIGVSSRSTPNAVEGREVFPGLASRSWIAEQEQDWGKDSALVKIHIDGQFVENERGALFPVHAIAEAESRWWETPSEGGLSIGVDPAGESGGGDESGFAVRRGKKVLALHTKRGVSADAHLVEVLGLIGVHRGNSTERPRVVIDREGEVGAKVWGVFIAYIHGLPENADAPFDLVGVRVSERAQRRPDVYDRVREELYASLADWLRDGGAIPADAKLARELNVIRWGEPHISGRTRAISKDEMREELGRSPDRADAIALACWGALFIGATAVEESRAAKTAAPDPYAELPEERFDPYGAMPGGDRGGIDPYG